MASGLRQACWKGIGSFTNWKELAYTAGATAYQVAYYVDAASGNDSNEGTSWERPFLTIDYACTVAAYSYGTSALSYTDKRKRTAVFIAPGHYDEGPLFTTYNTDIIGCGPSIPGTDYGVSINYSGAVSTTAVFGIMGSGNTVANLHLICNEAIPGFYMASGDNNLFANCVVESDGDMTYGFQMAGMKGCWIRDCIVMDAATAGIYIAGGDNVYAIHGGIENCQIYGDGTGCKGIDIQSTVTAYNFRINHNFIDVEGGGATSKGIDNNAASNKNMMITDNYITIATSATAAESTGYGILNNHVSTSGTVTDPFDDD